MSFEKCMALSQIYFLNLFRKVIGKQVTPLRFLEFLNYEVPYIRSCSENVSTSFRQIIKIIFNSEINVFCKYIKHIICVPSSSELTSRL